MRTPRFIVRRSARNAYRSLENSTNVQKFAARVAELRGLGVTVGVPQGAEQDGTSLALIAAANHFGVNVPGRPTIPERPFLTVGIRQGQPGFKRLNAVNLARVLRGQMTPRQAVGQLGAMAVGEVQKAIRSYGWVPNAVSTVYAKGSSQPLVDIGRLWQSITYELQEKGAAA